MRLCTLACLVFGATPLAAQNGPSFDCTKANSTAEELICADPALSALDREISRLYDLARGSVSGSDLAMLKAYQRGWIKGRDDCWKARVSITECISTVYIVRIHELRRDHPATQSEDGASLGPIEYRCDGLDHTVSAVVITLPQAPYASVAWDEMMISLPKVRAASGAKYETHDGILFWIQGAEARLSYEGQSYSCQHTPDT